jgi:hypothetical protein
MLYGNAHYVVGVVDPLNVALARHSNSLHRGRRLDAKLCRNLARQIEPKRPKVAWRDYQNRCQRSRFNQLVDADNVPLRALLGTGYTVISISDIFMFTNMTCG